MWMATAGRPLLTIMPALRFFHPAEISLSFYCSLPISMKPWRLTLTKGIIMAYGMHGAMDTYLSRAATKEEMAEFHKEDYLEFLQQ